MPLGIPKRRKRLSKKDLSQKARNLYPVGRPLVRISYGALCLCGLSVEPAAGFSHEILTKGRVLMTTCVVRALSPKWIR
jgi:hypothetical protein